jgi:hypothetical protein
MGAVLIRTPVASKKAFAIAAGTGTLLGSPEPVGARSLRWTILVLTFGASRKRRIG